MPKIVGRSTGGFYDGLQQYHRLTNPDRVGEGCAKKNETSALSILAESLRPSTLTILEALKAMPDATTAEIGGYCHVPSKQIATELNQCARMMEPYGLTFVHRILQSRPRGGCEFVYRLSPLGQAVLEVKRDGESTL